MERSSAIRFCASMIRNTGFLSGFSNLSMSCWWQSSISCSDSVMGSGV